MKAKIIPYKRLSLLQYLSLVVILFLAICFGFSVIKVVDRLNSSYIGDFSTATTPSAVDENNNANYI